MTDEPKFTKTWRVHQEGRLLGSTTIISPWNGKETEAVVDIATGEVIAAHGASCTPFPMFAAADAIGDIAKKALK